MSKTLRILLIALAIANLAAALAAGAIVFGLWAGETDWFPAAFKALEDWNPEEIFGNSILITAGALAASALVWLVSMTVREERRPIAALALIGLAASAVPAGMAGGAMWNSSPPVGIAAGIGVLPLGPALVFALEYVMGAITYAAAAGFEKSGAQGAAGRFFALARRFRPGNIALRRRQAFADYQSGAVGRAIESFEIVRAAGEANTEALEAMEVCYRAMKNWEKDREILEELLKRDPKDRAIMERLAVACERTDKWERAMALREALLDPRNLGQLDELARVALRLKQTDRALAIVRRAREREGKPYAKTLPLYNALLEADPKHLEALEDAAGIYADITEDPRALELLERALDIDPTRAETRRNAAERCRRLGELPREETHLRVLAELDGRPPDAVLRLAENLSEQDRHDESGAVLRKAIERNPGHFEFAYALAKHLVQQGKLDAASETLEKAGAAAADADQPRLRALRKQVETARDKRVIAKLRTEIKAKPTDIASRFALIERLASSGDLVGVRGEFDLLHAQRPDARPEAIQRLRALIQKLGNPYLLLDYQADLHLLEKDFDGALATYEDMARQSIHGEKTIREGADKILRANPRFIPALLKLAQVLMAEKDWARAVDAGNRLAEARGEMDADIANMLFEAHLALNEPAKAEEAALHLLKEHPGDVKVRLMLAELYEREQRFQDAVELLESRLRGENDNSPTRKAHDRILWKRKRQRLDELAAVIKTNPADAPAHFEAGSLQEEFNDLNAAISHYQKATRDETLHNLATARLGFTLSKREMFDLAEETLANVKLRPDSDREQEELKRLIYNSALLFEEAELGKRALNLYKAIFRADASFHDIVARIGKYGG